MAEDYERTNAREWDLQHGDSENFHVQGVAQLAGGISSEWKVVEGKRKQTQSKQRNSSTKQHAPQPKHRNALPTQHVPQPKRHNIRPTQQIPPSRQQDAPSKQHTSPRKWTNTRGREIETMPRRMPANLILDIDNEAQQLWRHRLPAQDTMRIPDELALQDRTHESLAQQHGAFIFSEHGKGINGIMTFGLWGENQAVAATKRAINAWIAEWEAVSGSKSRRSASFPKIQSLTPELRKRAENKWLREVKKQKFRQHPPPGSMFETIGSFHWPVQEYRPDEILGASYEALDPIRMECECYVVFQKDRSLFQVSGKVKDVQLALLRLRGTCFQIAARGITHVRTYLLQQPNASNMPSHIAFKAYNHPEIESNEAAVNMTSNMPCGKGSMNDESALVAEISRNEQYVGMLLMQTLKKLHYYAGDIHMRIHLGTFLATQYRKPRDDIYALEEYTEMIKETQFIGHVTTELGDKERENVVLASLQSADDLLQPEDAITVRLEAVRPVYSATFTFAEEAGDLCFTKYWYETEDKGAIFSSFEETSKKWTRLERNTGAAAPLLDISYSNLNTGMAWQFQIQASQVVDESRLSKALVDFGYSVNIDARAALNPSLGKSFVTYRPYGVNLKSIQQRLSYRYHIRTTEGFVTDYTLDLTRFQDRTFPLSKMPLLSGAHPTVYEPRWSLSVYRTHWNTMFAENAKLKIGQVADWEHDVDTWFPEDPSNAAGTESKGGGIELLMEKLKKIQTLVEDIKEDDLIGGMMVG